MEGYFGNENRINAKTKTSKNIKTKFAYGTAKVEASLINQFFTWCYKDKQGFTKKIIKLSPVDAFSKEELKRNSRRDNFTQEEWKKITLNLGNYVNGRGRFKLKNNNSLHKRQRQILRLYVMLLASTGLRVGEAKYLRWKDLSLDKENDVAKLNVVAETSIVRRQRITLSHSRHIYDELMEGNNKLNFLTITI